MNISESFKSAVLNGVISADTKLDKASPRFVEKTNKINISSINPKKLMKKLKGLKMVGKATFVSYWDDGNATPYVTYKYLEELTHESDLLRIRTEYPKIVWEEVVIRLYNAKLIFGTSDYKEYLEDLDKITDMYINESYDIEFLYNFFATIFINN